MKLFLFVLLLLTVTGWANDPPGLVRSDLTTNQIPRGVGVLTNDGAGHIGFSGNVMSGVTNLTVVNNYNQYSVISNVVAGNIQGPTNYISKFTHDNFSVGPSRIEEASGERTIFHGTTEGAEALGSAALVQGAFSSINPANGIVNILAFGAIGNGTTDDTIAFQSGLDAVCATPGGCLVLPPTPGAFYKITGTLTITNSCRISGYGATIKSIGAVTNVIVPVSSPSVTIEGLTFETDQVNPPDLQRAIFAQSEGLHNLRFINNRLVGMKTVFRNSTFTTEPTCTNLWVQGNTYTGDYTKSNPSGGDQADIVEIRGWSGFHFDFNNLDTSSEEMMLKLSNSGEHSTVHGNVMRSGGPSGNTIAIDAFANIKDVSFIGNHFYLTNYTDAISVKPTSSGFFSEPDLILIANNNINIWHTNTTGSALSLFGSWGLTDQTLSNSVCTVANNNIKVFAPNDASAQIYARGFTKVNISGNTITRTDRKDFMAAVDASNSKDVTYVGNNFEGGGITAADNQSNYPGTTYTNCTERLSIVGNTITGVPSFGCVWVTGCTNQNGLLSLLITGNTFYPTNGANATASLVRLDASVIGDCVITANVGASDYANILQVNGNVINGHKQLLGNSWDDISMVPYLITEVGTNINGSIFPIDFAQAEQQLIFSTNDIFLTATNGVVGKLISVKLGTQGTNRVVVFDPARINVAYPVVNTLKANHTAVVEIRYWGSDFYTARCPTDTSWGQPPDPTMAGVSPMNGDLQINGNLTVATNFSAGFVRPLNLTPSELVMTDGTTNLVSIANGEGVLWNFGSGTFSFTTHPEFHNDGVTLSLAPTTSDNASLVAFDDHVAGSARASFGIASNGDTNLTLTVNNGDIALNPSSGAVRFMVPITKAQRNLLIPHEGMLINQSDATAGLHIYQGGAWVSINTTADP